MTTKITDTTVLNNGVEMPWFGLGVWQAADGEEVVRAVTGAIQAGYRSIDTAAVYKNEAGVGQGIRESGVPREELFITTKVWNADQGYETTLAAFEASLKLLGLEYVDLYLIHWPVKGKYKETWKALEELYRNGRVRAIGVSNFHVSHLEDLLTDAEVVPAVNQVEYHPRLAQPELKQFCEEHNIQLEAWSPLMQGKLLDEPTLTAIAGKYNKSTAQVILRWDLQNEVVTIPKSVQQERIEANAQIFDFELSDEDMAAIDALNKNERTGPDPDNFDF
ncbi:glyoxal reductase [Paenibacillus swuensis]|uniref:Glyoxal reductase n=1 Tax=Paenibacillus swuensis TaxID=1178515 RepID=A0A172TKR7_9BACL|nr:aldo/keto reductase [Paenibacillus swuensis]ANE47620.1 glyoxal reductase [Paenibacillus swuensis]